MSSLVVRRHRGIRFSFSASFLGLEGAEVVVLGREGKVGLEGMVNVGVEASVCGGIEVRGVTVNYIPSNTFRHDPDVWIGFRVRLGFRVFGA